MPALAYSQLIERLTAAQLCFKRLADGYRKTPLAVKRIQEPGKKARLEMGGSAPPSALEGFKMFAAQMLPLLTVLGIPVPDGPDETEVSKWLAALDQLCQPAQSGRRKPETNDRKRRTNHWNGTEYSSAFDSSCIAVDKLLKLAHRGELAVAAASSSASTAGDSLDPAHKPLLLFEVAAAIAWEQADHHVLVPDLKAAQDEALEELAKANGHSESSRLVVLSKRAAEKAVLLDWYLDRGQGDNYETDWVTPSAAVKLVQLGVREQRGDDVDPLSPWYRHGQLLTMVVRLDVFACAVARLRRRLDQDQLSKLSRAAMNEPLCTWLGLSGRPDEVALNSADERRRDVVAALISNAINRIPRVRKEPENPDRDVAALTARLVSKGGVVEEIPLDALARWGINFGSLIERRRVAQFTELSFLNASCDRLLLHLGSNAASAPAPEPPTPTQLQPADRLSPGATALWNHLPGRSGLAKQLAGPSYLNTTEATIRTQVAEIRRVIGKGSVLNKTGYGYFRPDNPPDWNSLKPTRKRHVRTT